MLVVSISNMDYQNILYPPPPANCFFKYPPGRALKSDFSLKYHNSLSKRRTRNAVGLNSEFTYRERPI